MTGAGTAAPAAATVPVRPALIGIAFALLVYAAVHVLARNVYPLWFDELFTAYWIEHPHTYLWWEGQNTEANPPLYYSLLRLWSAQFGIGELALRSLSLLAGGLGVTIAVLIGQVSAGPRVAMLSGVFAALLPVGVLFAWEARPVALLPSLQGALLLACLMELKQAIPQTDKPAAGPSPDSRAGPCMFVVFAVVSNYTHPIAPIFVASCCTMYFFVYLYYRLPKVFFWRWGGMTTKVFLLSLPQAFWLVRHSTDVALAWRPAFGLRAVAAFVMEFLLGEGAYGLSSEAKALLCLLLLGIASRGVIHLDRPARLALCGIPTLFVASVMALSFATPLLWTRYMLGLTGPWAVLLAAGCAPLLWRGVVRPLALALVAGGLAVLTARQSTRGWEGEWHPTQDWRGVTARLLERPECGGEIYADVLPGLAAWPYYDPEGRLARRFFVSDEAADPGRGHPFRFEAFFERVSRFNRISWQEFSARLESGQQMTVILVGRIAEQYRLGRTVRDSGRRMIRYDFPPGVSLMCLPGANADAAWRPRGLAQTEGGGRRSRASGPSIRPA